LLSAGLASSEGLRTLVVGFSGMVVGVGCSDVVVVTFSVVVVTSGVVVVVVDDGSGMGSVVVVDGSVDVVGGI
jgi:hypothetical protein